MQQRHAHCLARRARFVLDHWGVFSPFLEPHNRPRDGPLARRLLALEQAGPPLPEEGWKRAGLPPVVGQPAAIVNGRMRDYQVQGLRWLVHQHDRSASCILGDEVIPAQAFCR